MKELYAYRERMMQHWEAAPSALQEASARLTAADWKHPCSQKAPTPHQALAHLRDIERDVITPCITRLLEGDAELPYPFPSWEAWLATYDPQEAPQNILEAYLALRAAEIGQVRGRVPIPWSIQGRHPQYGKRTLQWWVEQSLAQARYHLRLLTCP